MTNKTTFIIGVLNVAMFLVIAFLAMGCNSEYLSEYEIDKLTKENADFANEVKIHRISYRDDYFSIPIIPNAWHEMTAQEKWDYGWKRNAMQTKAYKEYKRNVYQFYVKIFGQSN